MSELLLFYHENSEACQKLKQHIPKDSKIKYVDIGLAQSLPSVVTSVPCLIVNGKEVHIGKKVFDYFNETDDFEYLNLSGKNTGFGNSYSSIDDDNVNSTNIYSSIDAEDMSKGIPEWNDEKQSGLDLDKFQAQRELEFKNGNK